MSFKRILCQNNVIQLFQGIIAKGRIAHAYIFTGTDGVGKALFAKELVKTLFCESVQKTARAFCEGNYVSVALDACDNCRTCRRVESDNHPDVHWIVPEKEDKFIRIEYIHVLQDDVALKPVEADRKVFIISEANRMNEESSNCLLKTLEEPPPDTMIILITTSVKSLRKTITSRCQIVRFNPFPSSTVEAELATRTRPERVSGFDTKSAKANLSTTADTRLQRVPEARPEALKWMAQFSCGSLGRAVEFLEKGIYERANYITKRLSSLKLDDIFSFSKEIVEWDSYQGETSEEKRSRLRLILEIFLQFYRDALLFKT
ncbi:MAG: DNA polymerase III subunit, partial [Candidatus Brocadiales bacterium]|nr:DNA polymerase III subunit [Candidatus Brocadiales bacterium]